MVFRHFPDWYGNVRHLFEKIAKKNVDEFGNRILREEDFEVSLVKKVDTEFVGRKQYKEMIEYLANADIAVNPISKGAAQSIINKHSDYAASGLPVVSTQENKEYQS